MVDSIHRRIGVVIVVCLLAISSVLVAPFIFYSQTSGADVSLKSEQIFTTQNQTVLQDSDFTRRVEFEMKGGKSEAVFDGYVVSFDSDSNTLHRKYAPFTSQYAQMGQWVGVEVFAEYPEGGNFTSYTNRTMYNKTVPRPDSFQFATQNSCIVNNNSTHLSKGHAQQYMSEGIGMGLLDGGLNTWFKFTKKTTASTSKYTVSESGSITKTPWRAFVYVTNSTGNIRVDSNNNVIASNLSVSGVIFDSIAGLPIVNPTSYQHFTISYSVSTNHTEVNHSTPDWVSTVKKCAN